MGSDNKLLFCEKTFDGFLARLQEHEIATCTKFVLAVAPKKFTIEQVSPTKNQRIHWQDDIPYFKFGTRTYNCQHGKDGNLSIKNKYAEERNKKALMDHCFIKRYNVKQPSKKLNCPASIIVARVIRMPEHKLDGSLSRQWGQMKTAKLIKKKVENGESVGEEVFIFNLPNVDEHKNHPIGGSAITTEPVDRRVRDHIIKLVTRGERNAVVISKLLKTFVHNELQEYDELRRRFYPNVATIRSIIFSAKSKFAKSHIDYNEECSISSLNEENSEPQYQELPLKGSNRRHLVNDCNATLRSLQAVLWNLEENDLNTLSITLRDVYKDTCSKMSHESNGLPIQAGLTDLKDISKHKKKDYKKLSLSHKRGSSRGVGMTAEMITEPAKVSVEDEPLILFEIEGKIQCSVCMKWEYSALVSGNKKAKSICKLCS